MFARINLSTAQIDGGLLSALPADLVGLSQASLDDIAAAIDPAPEAYAGAGYWPASIVTPDFDPLTQAIGEGFDVVVDTDARRVVATQKVWALTPEEIEANAPTADDINAERDRRTVLGFVFNGVRFQSRPQDRENIMGAFALASAALTVGGKAPGDLRWHGGQSDFVFIAEDDSRVPMDAVAVLGLGQAAANQKSALTFVANDLKKLDPIPVDYADDAHWPPVD